LKTYKGASLHTVCLSTVTCYSRYDSARVNVIARAHTHAHTQLYTVCLSTGTCYSKYDSALTFEKLYMVRASTRDHQGTHRHKHTHTHTHTHTLTHTHTHTQLYIVCASTRPSRLCGSGSTPKIARWARTGRRHKSSKVQFTVALYSKRTRPLTFQNFGAGATHNVLSARGLALNLKP